MKVITSQSTALILTYLVTVNASLTSYFQQLGKYFGYGDTAGSEIEDFYNKRIPYEVSTADEKFISEAAKLTGLALSELDSCQHRVVLKLEMDCHKMNDETVAKMAVHLLNCQSFVEGRRMYPCTDEMSIRDCTTDMDSDTWTSYHLMSNRARAVCYTIRQAQFRGLAEQTVNKLMDTARHQLSLLGKIEDEQRNIQEIAENTLDTVEKGHVNIMGQQQDIQKAQFHTQLTLEDNIGRLLEEKRLISESQDRLAAITQVMQRKLELAAKEIETQTGQSKHNHQELLDDIVAIQNKAQIIYQRIEDSAELLLKQTEIAKKQYQATLAQLAEVNRTVNGLIELVTGTKRTLEEKLAWLSASLGGTDLALERLYVILWHSTLLVVSMIGCAFLGAPTNVRLVVAGLPPLNLALALSGSGTSSGPSTLISLIVGFSLAQISLAYIMKRYSAKQSLHLPWKGASPKSNANTSPKLNVSDNQHRSEFLSGLKSDGDDSMAGNMDDFVEYISPTPPLSSRSYYSRSRSRTPLLLNGSSKGPCKAKTRVGTPCKISALPGRDFCYRHQAGDSVML